MKANKEMYATFIISESFTSIYILFLDFVPINGLYIFRNLCLKCGIPPKYMMIKVRVMDPDNRAYNSPKGI